MRAIKEGKANIFKALPLAIAAVVSAASAQGQGDQTPTARGSIDEIIVTARRREESGQDIPLTLTVLDAAAIEKAGIKSLFDLNAAVPGINMSSSGNPANTVFSIRGISRVTFGPVQPAVSTYVNDVPLAIWGAAIPTYDMATLQVLKGPQGTLFGRNSTTGAVIATTQAPSHEFGGFVTTSFGNYSSQVYEGAVDLPLIKDKVALRLAGQIDKRDGYTKDMVYGDDLDNRDKENYRISLLVEPTEDIRNVFVYDYTNDDSEIVGNVPIRDGFGLVDVLPFTNGTFFNPFSNPPVPCNGNPLCDFNALIARQEAGGIRKVWPSVDQWASFEREIITNTTTWNITENITLKNIIGKTEYHYGSLNTTDGSQMNLINSQNDSNGKQFTNEFQVLGNALGGDLEYILGYFYLDSEPDGDNKLSLQLFNPAFVPFAAVATGAEAFYYDESRAYFAQGSLELSRLSPALAKFSVDVGFRHTEDKTKLCSTRATPLNVYIGAGAACSGQVAGTSKVSDEFSKETFLVGLNYQHSDDVLLYGLYRTGYRAGGLNAPAFGGELVPFQSFDPEDTTEIEVGIKSDWQLGNVIGRFNLAAFQSDIEDVQGPFSVSGSVNNDPDNDGDPSNNPTTTNVFSNAGEASVKGVEMELVVQPMENLELSAIATFLDKKLDKLTLTRDKLPTNLSPAATSETVIEQTAFLGSPDYSYSVSGTYTLPLDGSIGDVAVSARYHKMSDITYSGVEAPSYHMVDARLDWTGMFGSSFDSALWVKNATDEEALMTPSSSGAGLGYVSGTFSTPRMYGVTLKYSF